MTAAGKSSSSSSSSSIAQFLVDLIIQPGASLKLVPIINISVILLLGLLCALSYTEIDTIHIVVMAALSIGLLLSVNWFYLEYSKAVKEQKPEGDENDDTKID